MKIVNLFGGPGVGKTTAAHGLIAAVKRRGLKAEFVGEYVKAAVWENRQAVLRNQIYIFGKQHKAIEHLEGRVDWVINEAPLINGLAYMPDDYFLNFAPLVREVWSSFDNVNFLLLRRFAYEQEGRYQTEAEAHQVDDRIERMLERECVPHTAVGADRAVDTILDHLGLGAVPESAPHAPAAT